MIIDLKYRLHQSFDKNAISGALSRCLNVVGTHPGITPPDISPSSSRTHGVIVGTDGRMLVAVSCILEPDDIAGTVRWDLLKWASRFLAKTKDEVSIGLRLDTITIGKVILPRWVNDADKDFIFPDTKAVYPRNDNLYSRDIASIGNIRLDVKRVEKIRQALGSPESLFFKFTGKDCPVILRVVPKNQNIEDFSSFALLMPMLEVGSR